MSRARRSTIKILVNLILMPLLSGCAYLQYFGLFPSTGSVEDSPTGKTIVAGVMVNEQGTPLSGIVMLEEGQLFRGKFRRGGIVDSSGRFAVEVPGGRQWGLHGYADGYIYHPESITVARGKINRYRWVLSADKNPQDKPTIRRITLTPDPAPGVTVTITLDAFDPKRRLSEQILALNARTGDSFVMEPPEQPRWGRPLEGKLYPNGIYRATYGPLPFGSDVNDWVFVVANEDCSISRITRAPFDHVGSAGMPQVTQRERG
jgi:hypothetical protein